MNFDLISYLLTKEHLHENLTNGNEIYRQMLCVSQKKTGCIKLWLRK